MNIATAEDFIAAAQQRRLANAQPLTLPSGLTVMAQRPGPEWWMRNVGRLPSSIASRFVSGNSTDPVSSGDLVEMARWTALMISEVVVSPVIRLNPGPSELEPHLISNDDLDYIMRFAGGEIAADGQGLDMFSRPAGSTPAVRANG
jgi:hypothetical protein